MSLIKKNLVMRKLAIAPILVLLSCAFGAQAGDCLTTDNMVEREGKVCAPGKGMSITSAAEMLIPKDWKMRFLEEEVSLQKVSWPDGMLWVDTLDLIGRTSNVGFLVDGHKKIVVAMRPNDNVLPGSIMINSRIARTREFLNLDELYTRVDDTERARREKLARKKATLVPNTKLNSQSLVDSRRTYVNVENTVFVSTVHSGDLEETLKEFFWQRWNRTLVLNKHGFSSKPALTKPVTLKGSSVVDDAAQLKSILNEGGDYAYDFRIYKGNDVVELTITCRVCNYE